MGATILKRGNTYRVRLRYKGLKDLSINFKYLTTAEHWIKFHEEKYLEDPESYHQWLEINRKNLKKTGLFHTHIPKRKI